MERLRRWRASWGFPTTLLCVFGFFSSVKPIEPFLISYLTGPDKNLTMEQVTNQIFPVWTYSYLSVLLPVFLLTDWLRYRPVMALQCVALLATSGVLLWGVGVASMQAVQFCYGVATACEVAYFSVAYSLVRRRLYPRVASLCRAAQLVGYTLGAAAAQLLLSLRLLDYRRMLALTLALVGVATLAVALMPVPAGSMFFHRRSLGEGEGEEEPDRGGGGVREEEEEKEGGAHRTPEAETGAGCLDAALRLWRDFLECFSSPEMLIWSTWWALATCGYNQVVNYVQALWEALAPSQDDALYNGAVEAVSNLFSAAAAYGVGFSRVDWSRWGELALGSLSALGGAALYAMTFVPNIWICYGGYVVFKSLYMLLITIAMFRIAAGLSLERYALVFGVNTFIALVLQTILTAIVVDSRGLGLGVTTQFIIYASYFCFIALIFFVRGVYTQCLRRTKHTHTDTHTSTDTNTHVHTLSVKL